MWNVRVEMIGCPVVEMGWWQGVRCAGRSRKTWRECVKDDMDELGLHSEWVVFRDMWRGLILGKTSDPI
jgi:hypothetical protein